MELRKTTLLPLDDGEESRRLLKQLIFEEPRVLFVVLGQGEERARLASRAGKLAGREDEWRWVVWVRSPQDVQPVLEQLRGEAGLREKLLTKQPQAFTLSLSDELRDVILAEERADNVRVLQAFVRAEKT